MSQSCVDKDLISGFLVPDSFQAIFPDILQNIGSNVQKVTIPDFSIGMTEVSSPVGARVKLAGDSVTYSALTMTFAMDQNLVIYNTIMAWMKACAYPEDPSQFDNFTERYLTWHGTKEEALYRNFTLVSTSGTKPMTWEFYQFFPISMSGIEFDTTLSDATMTSFEVTFEYTYFDVKESGQTFSTGVK